MLVPLTKPVHRPGRRCRPLLLGALAIALITMATFPTTAYAADPPVVQITGCFNGSLSQDPLHCHVFEAAHNAGLFEIEAVYSVGSALNIYLTQSEPLGEDDVKWMHNKAQEEVRRSGGPECVLDDEWLCSSGVIYSLSVTVPGLPRSVGFILPASEVYDDIRLLPGGAEARKQIPGWASYRLLWPTVPGGNSGAGTRSDGSFDISEVDTTNIPEVDCSDIRGSIRFRSCDMWRQFPTLGLAGYVSRGYRTYVQVKAPNGEQDKLDAAKTALRESYPLLSEEQPIMISVKYDYGELWKWATIINRFAHSSGNTLGIGGATVGINLDNYASRISAWPVPGITHNSTDNPMGVRTIIRVFVLDLDEALEPLPRLLEQLNIPVDSVGVVFQVHFKPAYRNLDLSRGPFVITNVNIPGYSAGGQLAPAPTDGLVSEIMKVVAALATGSAVEQAEKPSQAVATTETPQAEVSTKPVVAPSPAPATLDQQGQSSASTVDDEVEAPVKPVPVAPVAAVVDNPAPATLDRRSQGQSTASTADDDVETSVKSVPVAPVAAVVDNPAPAKAVFDQPTTDQPSASIVEDGTEKPSDSGSTSLTAPGGPSTWMWAVPSAGLLVIAAIVVGLWLRRRASPARGAA